MRRGLSQPSGGDLVRSPKTGLRTVGLERVITSEDVRSLEDE